MRVRSTARFLAVLLMGLAAVPSALAAGPGKKPLDHDVYEVWSAIDGETISADGAWALYSLTHEVGDGSIHIRSLKNDQEYMFERGVSGAFSRDASHAVFRQKPPLDVLRQARRDKKKGDDLPKDNLGIVNLATGELRTIERVKSFAMPAKASGPLAVLLEKPEQDAKPDAEDEPKGTSQPVNPAQTAPEPASEPAPAEGRDKNTKNKKESAKLLVIDLNTNARRSFEHVTEYAFDERGAWLAFIARTKTGEGDGVFVVDLSSGDVAPIMTGEGESKSLAFDKSGAQLAFLSTHHDASSVTPAGNTPLEKTHRQESRESEEANQPWSLYAWRAGEDHAEMIVSEGDSALPSGWWVSEHRAPNFSESGDRLFFGMAPRPAAPPDPKDPATPLEDELPKLDIWHWNEPDLHTMQLEQLDAEKKRSYLAMAERFGQHRVHQLADVRVRDVSFAAKGDSNVAIGVVDEPYRKMVQWDVQELSDLVVINPVTGERDTILQGVKGQPWSGSWLSPAGLYVTFWDYDEQAWFAHDIRNRSLINLSASIPHPVFNEDHDTPSPPGPVGLGGWLDDDAGVLIYDRYDIWLVDPRRPDAPRAITESAGRAGRLRFRVIDLDRERDSINPSEPMMLSAFSENHKGEGFYRDQIRGLRKPEQLLMAARRFSTPRQADEADTLLFTRESYREFPDLWVSGPDFSTMRKISDANPQQADYRWGNVKLVEWSSTRGRPLQGLLYTPDDFDPANRYPMMVTFYERNSDNLHAYAPPTPHRSTIRASFYASRGYLVFVPDIVYEDGHPGRSAVECVLPGVAMLIDEGFVDPKRIGVQGHSWGGYQIAYLVTQTNLFAAADAGAPVSNMTSAYGGIRWASGMSRQFQYERTQSRIGGTLWEKPLLYLENSPLFHLESVTTPLLILHNDQDGAVPWQQGIELFMGLRRLGKPAWMLNYNDQPHWPLTYPNRRDYAIRMQQFFDHYLMNAPAPVWMESGVPAVEKGREFGLDLVEPK